jgi:hypothetical protein
MLAAEFMVTDIGADLKNVCARRAIKRRNALPGHLSAPANGVRRAPRACRNRTRGIGGLAGKDGIAVAASPSERRLPGPTSAGHSKRRRAAFNICSHSVNASNMNTRGTRINRRGYETRKLV